MEGACKKDGERCFSKGCSHRIRGSGLQLKEGGVRLDIRKKIFMMRVAQVAQRSCGCPIIGNVQGQVGQGLEQPGLVEDVAANGRAVELDDI